MPPLTVAAFPTNKVILLSALVAGLLAGWGWSRLRKRPYQVPNLQVGWLAALAFLPQIGMAYLPATRHLVSDGFVATSLIISLLLFLGFVWWNRQLPGMPILMSGLILNLLVMVANGGWMPIDPKTASQLVGTNVLQIISAGSRFGQKDILLLPQQIHFGVLADRFLLPAWFPYQVAFSLGDILIALGIFWLLLKSPASNIANNNQYPNGVETP